MSGSTGEVWEALREGLGRFDAEPGQVQHGSGFGVEPGQVPQGSGEGSGEGLEPGGSCRARSGSKGMEKVWEALMQSQVRFSSSTGFWTRFRLCTFKFRTSREALV